MSLAAPATYLQLVIDAKIECGMTAPDPTTVANQTGDMRRIVNWVADAYKEIQGRCAQWRWMRKPFTLNTVAGTDTYAYGTCTDTETAASITRFAFFWVNDAYRPMSIYPASSTVASQRWLIPIPYDRWKRLYKFGAQQLAQSPPIHVSQDDNKKLILGPNPDQAYIITGEYQRSMQVLSADGDTPEMPSDFHKLIVYGAMKKYAGYKSAADVMSRAVAEGTPLMRRLEREQMPEIKLAGSLA